jgi:hypothetical protein
LVGDEEGEEQNNSNRNNNRQSKRRGVQSTLGAEIAEMLGSRGDFREAISPDLRGM